MHPLNGYKAALIALISFLIGLFGIISTAQNANPSGGVVLFGVLFVVLAVFLMKGLKTIVLSSQSNFSTEAKKSRDYIIKGFSKNDGFRFSFVDNSNSLKKSVVN